MKFEPFENKLVVVLNKNIETGRAMNAIAHMALGLGHCAEDKEKLRLQDYKDADGQIHPNISDIPFIVLRANATQIRNLRKLAAENEVSYTDFTNTMIGETYVDQHENTAKTKEIDLEYFGICMLGDWNTLTEMTKKLSLWR